MADDEESPTLRMPNSIEWKERIHIEELSSIARNLADAVEGLLSQAAVDGADDDEIDPQSVFAATAALDEFKRHPYFCTNVCGLPPETSKLKNKPVTPWENDQIQFARLLCEISATQVQLDMKALAVNMDLSLTEVNQLFDRAHVFWETTKAQTCTPSNSKRESLNATANQKIHN
jgi:hypothetical protein